MCAIFAYPTIQPYHGVETEQPLISQYENNNRQATFDVIEKIANYCEFEIVFRDTKSKEEYTLKDIDRKI